MKRCWNSDPKERGTFDQIENELTAELAEDIREFPCHDYYQFVPIRDTEIGGVIKDCGLRMESKSKGVEENLWREAFDGKEDKSGYMGQQRRRYSF